MENIYFNLVHENKKFKIYKNKYYELGIEKNTNEIISIKALDVMTPNLYIKDKNKIRIASIGYGELTEEDIREMIEKYNIALLTAEEIKKNFI